jgi:molybdopterin/thiamine biosynthesis adenylyltransferase
MERYARNGILSAQEQERLFHSTVLIVGSGGLGGYILEMLVRIGIGHITLVDGDVFEESNLNRQLLATAQNLGTPKVNAGRERAQTIDPRIRVKTLQVKVTADNAFDLVSGHDIVFDALDSIGDRRILLEACQRNKIPMVHGAIAGWMGQVSFIAPGDDTLSQIYPKDAKKGYETLTGNPSFTPALVAGLQVAEGIKYLTGKGDLVRNALLSIDLLTHTYQVISL